MPSILEILDSLDDLHHGQLYIALVQYVYRDLVPMFMLESVAFGMVSLTVLLLVYCAIKGSSSRNWKHTLGYVVPAAAGYAAFAAHWSYSLRSIYDLPVELGFFSNFFAEAIMFGALSTLVLVLYFSFCLGTITRSNSSSLLLLGTVTVMYAMALLHFAAGVRGWVSEDLGGFALLRSDSSTGRIVLITLAVNTFFSDAVALWRACVVWMNRRAIVYVSATLLLVGIVSGVANLVLVCTSSPAVSIFGPFYDWPGLVFLGSSLLSNVFSTAVIAWKAWMQRRRLRGHLLGSRRTMAERVLVIFVESSAIFICVWAAYIALVVEFNTLEGVNLGSSLSSIYAFHNMMIQVVTIYPTCIILLVVLEKRRNLSAMPSLLSSAAHVPPIVTVHTMVHTEPGAAVVIGLEEFGARSSQEDSEHEVSEGRSNKEKRIKITNDVAKV